MTKEDKELLLKDLCARLPYNVKVKYYNTEYPYGSEPVILTSHLLNDRWENIQDVKPYLRPMSGMTKEEKKELCKLSTDKILESFDSEQGYNPVTMAYNSVCVDYCLSHYLDYRGLISTGLALEAKEGMYRTE